MAPAKRGSKGARDTGGRKDRQERRQGAAGALDNEQAWGDGLGGTPPAAGPAKCAMSTMKMAPTESAIARNLAKSITRG